MASKTYSARTPEDLKALSEEHGDVQVVIQLNENELKSPASKWKIRHLIAYRLLVGQSEEAFLQILGTGHDELCPVCRDDQSCPQKLNRERTKAFTDGGPRDLHTKTECELLQLPDGFFWVALARAIHPERADEAREHPQRERTQVERKDYVNPMTAIIGSSSPVGPSSSEFEVDIEDLDEDEHDARRSKPEEVTVHLVTCFLQHALNLCLLQHSAGTIVETEVRARIERKTADMRVAGTVTVTAEDDGGVCRVRWQNHGWVMDHAYLALLEAKRAFKHINFDEKTGKHTPVVSNENLAQYLGEAVIAWKKHQKLLQQDIFVIAATNTFVRFIHFKFGRDYAEYVDALDETAQIELINDEEKDVFVYMHNTKWFNLQSHEGRRTVLCHILALLRWHDAQDALRRQAADDAMGLEEDDDQNYDGSMESEEDSDQEYDDDLMDTEDEEN